MAVENGPPEGLYVQAGPIRMHYLEYGDRTGHPVVFLHGSGPVSYTHLTLPTIYSV